MTNAKINTQANGFEFHYIGWKYYNQVKKKAMEQEFSWSGLVLSLSIAFFIVVSCALALNMIYQSINSGSAYNQQPDNKIYRMESLKSLNINLC